MKGIGLSNKYTYGDREFQIHTGNDPQKNIIKSEVFEKGQFLFSYEDNYNIREQRDRLDADYLKAIAYDQHQNTLDEIKVLFLVNEKIKQLRQYLPHYRLGKVFLKRNFVYEAIENLVRVVELAPDFIRGHQKLGMAYYKAEKYADAIKALLQAHKLNPDYPDILNFLGSAYTKISNFSAASKFLKKALEIKENYNEANFNLGVVLFLSTLSDENEDEKVIIPARFIRSFKSLLEDKKYQSREWHERLITTQKVLEEGDRKKVKSALFRLQDDILFGEERSDIMDFFFLQFMYGGKELKNNKLDEFEKLIYQEVSKHEEYADYWNELGIIHLIQCREYFVKAISEFEKSHKLDPEYESAKRNCDLLKHNKQGFLILLRAILK
ncbi:MAG: tetratricopeptide repeat protein [Calditrichae bacterium]|nr:tetratricopeptide repeat protein [Calditrichota bacterium]MCB9057091.1 tetratricopeptide repeat protein [Calditrichia bacterium]